MALSLLFRSLILKLADINEMQNIFVAIVDMNSFIVQIEDQIYIKGGIPTIFVYLTFIR